MERGRTRRRGKRRDTTKDKSWTGKERAKEMRTQGKNAGAERRETPVQRERPARAKRSCQEQQPARGQGRGSDRDGGGGSTQSARCSETLQLALHHEHFVVHAWSWCLEYSILAPLASTPIWERDFSSSEELLTEFARECRIVRKGLNGDLKKAMKDGKPIIIEGIHLDPRIYLVDEQGGDVAGNTNLPAVVNLPSAPIGVALEADLEHANEMYSANKGSENHWKEAGGSLLDSQCDVASEGLHQSGDIECNAVDTRSISCGDTSVQSEEATGSESTKAEACTSNVDCSNDAHAESSGLIASAKAIVVPIVLRMDEFDHKTLLEEWIGCKSFSAAPTDEAEKEASISKLMTLQDYLCSFKSQGITVMNISATTFQQTIDALHSYLLQRIEDVVKREIRES